MGSEREENFNKMTAAFSFFWLSGNWGNKRIQNWYKSERDRINEKKKSLKEGKRESNECKVEKQRM